MAPTKTVPANPPFMKGSILWERKGALPVWAWVLIVVGGLLLVMQLRRNRGQASTAYRDELPGDQSARPIFVVPGATPPAVHVQLPATNPAAPPASGAPSPTTVPLTVSVPLERDIYDWIGELNRDFGLSLDFGKLESMNPGMRKYIRWDTVSGSPNKSPKFHKWHPTMGIPPMRIREQ